MSRLPPRFTRTDTRLPYTTLFRSHGDVQVTGLQPGELRDVVGLHVLHVVACLLQHRAHDLCGDELAGPVVQGELDGVLRFDLGLCRARSAEADSQRRPLILPSPPSTTARSAASAPPGHGAAL